jgi:hypothetical protein
MEAVLDFGRGRQKRLKSCYGECMGGGGRKRGASSCPRYRIWMGGGGGEEAALQLFALHMYVVLFLVPLSPFSILL